MISPTVNSKKLLEKEGYAVGITEKWNPHVKIRQDLFNFVDLLAIHESLGAVGIQTTTQAHISERIKKAINCEHFKTWLKAGLKVEFHGWHKKKNRWEVDRREAHLIDDKVNVSRIP